MQRVVVDGRHRVAYAGALRVLGHAPVHRLVVSEGRQVVLVGPRPPHAPLADEVAIVGVIACTRAEVVSQWTESIAVAKPST